MQRYPVRSSHKTHLALPALESIARLHFEGVEVAGNAVTGHFGAISRISAHGEGKELVVDLTMDPKVTPEVASETIQHYNRFLEETTGFSSKERAKRLKKSTQAEDSGA